MIALSLNRPGEGAFRALAWAAAVVVPLLVLAAVGERVAAGPGVLLMLLPVVIAAGIGGAGPGTLATGVGAAPALVRAVVAGGGDVGWLAAYLAVALVAVTLFARLVRRVDTLHADRERLAADHRFQSSIAELSGDGAWCGRIEAGRVILERATPALGHALGLALEEINTRGGWGALVHADDRAAFESQCRSLAQGERTTSELRYDLRRGMPWLQCEMRQRREEEGGDGAVIGVVRDVTARHELVDGLRSAKERNEATVQAAGLVLCDLDFVSGRMTFGGDSEAVLGQWPADLSGWIGDWMRRVHPDDAPRLRQALDEARRDGTRFSAEYRVRHADGRYVAVEHGGVPEGAADGDPPRRLVGFLRDVSAQRSEERRLERELQRRLQELGEADRRKDEFLATLAHELRNPLAPIRNASMLLGLGDGNAQSIDWIRRVIDRQTDHLARLIDDLLDVSRLTSDKITLRLERVELKRVIDNAVDTVRSQVDAQRHRLTVEVAPELWLQGDQVRLTQVFSNLLNNAVKYTSPGGAIEVRATVEAGWVSVAVRDNGVGIPPDQIGRLFEMFYQVDRSIERAHAGLGIGLTLVERLVRMHGGEVSAHSDGIGRGSTFVVRLPLADRPATTRTTTPATGRVVRGLRILVADDSVDSALTLTAILSAAGHDVQAVHDGFAALQRAADFRPQVLVLDIGMPGLNGYDTCRRIRAEPWGRNAVIIAVTGWGADEDRRRSREAGFDAHLVKPVDYAELQKYFAPHDVPM